MRKLPFLAAVLAIAFGTIGQGTAQEQSYPTRPVTMVVPYPAGGTTDTIGRIIAEGMRESLGQPVVIQNVAGASGSIGVGRVARAAPDGYTIGMGNLATHVFNGSALNLDYDLLKNFEPISLLASEPMLIVGKKDALTSDLKGLIAWLKAHPEKALAGTGGAGGISHIVGVFFQNETGTRFRFVPYRGLAPAMQDLLAGRTDIMFDSAANSLPQVRAERIKAYAVTAENRLASAPDIPTVDEAGLPGFHVVNWQALFAPEGTPKEIIVELNAAVQAALADPEVRKRLGELGQEIPPRNLQTPGGLGAYHKSEIEKWGPIIEAAHIKPK